MPLDDTLRDLALIRACDIDLSSLVPASQVQSSRESTTGNIDKSVERSYEFAREARAALKILHREEAEKQGTKIEDIRNTLEDTLAGLADT